MPHEGSKYHNTELFDDLSLDICSIRSKYDIPLMIVGDLNSRTGLTNDIMLCDQSDNDILDASNFKYPDIIDIFNSMNVPLDRKIKTSR